MKTLKELIDNKLTDKGTVHSYIEVYQKLFEPKQNDKVNVLEIGINTGGSHILWNNFFNNGKIYGVDILPPPEIFKTYKRIKPYQFDAYNPELIKKYFGDIKFDIIIDDGSHTLKSMKVVAKYYSHLLKPDGILVIEDIRDKKWLSTISQHFPEEMKQFIEYIDLRSVKNRFDDMMIIANMQDSEHNTKENK